MHSRTQPPSSDDEGALRRPDPGRTGDDAGGTEDGRRQVEEHARISAEHRARADVALADADGARGRAAAADGEGDTAAAGAAWSEAAGLDGLAAHEGTTAAIEARASAAIARSITTTGRSAGRGQTQGGTAGQRNSGRATTPPAPRRSV